MNARRGERHAVVGPNGLGEPILAEQSIEDRAHAAALGREQAMARQEIARVLVGDGERIAIEPITCSKMALEVRGPEIVGRRRPDRNDTRMLVVAAAPSCLH